MDDKAVRAILFDLDDTLIETSRAGGVAIQKVIKTWNLLQLHFKLISIFVQYAMLFT